MRRTSARSCPHILCRPLHSAAFLLGLGSALAASLASMSALVSVVALGALATVLVRFVLGTDLLATGVPYGSGRAAREMWAYVAVGSDVTLATLAAVTSHTAFHHPARTASAVALGWDGRSYALVATVVAAALLWQVLHLQAMRPAA